VSELHLVPNSLMFLLENGEIMVETTELVGIREVGCVKFWNLVSSVSLLRLISTHAAFCGIAF